MGLETILPLVLAAVLDAPVFPASVSPREVPSLLEATAMVRGLDEAALARMVPEQSGLKYVGCPNCTRGRQENQLGWSPDRPDEVACRYCKHRYPSATYPMDRALTVRDPRGQPRRYPYWEDARGYRYFFRARRDDLVREYLAERTRDLARLYAATGDRAHARRAALLLDRFARVFPGWCYHYDYPFRQKEIHDGDVPPARFRPGFRTARWTWWAYMDIPVPLVQAHDWIRGSGALDEMSRAEGTDVAARIERDLLRNAAEQVLANGDDGSNMSPTAWRALVTTGRVLGEPRYVHEVVRRLRRLVDRQFFYDGSWSEGAPSYASQTLGGLGSVLDSLRNYSDPPGYRAPDGTRFDRLDLATEFPSLRLARSALEEMRLPGGRPVPVHDTWRTGRRRPGGSRGGSTGPHLLPALGHARLGGGSGDAQTQFHLTWSGGYGHQHADNLSLLLFAHGREMLSDLGYTHTRYRSWTLATAAHNTVVIDGESQAFGGRDAPSDGSLRIFDAGDRRVQVVGADGDRGYPGLAKTYRRTLVVVDAGGGRRYAVDLFEVDGGRVHDYFLHGDVDAPTTAAAGLGLSPMATLLPAGFDWTPTRNEGEAGRAREPHYAYGFLRNLRGAAAPSGVALPVTFRTARGEGPALRVTLLSEPGSRLVLGDDPSISPAGEDDAKLEEFLRPFLMLRHEAGTGRSTFAAVIEPYAAAPFLDGVERIPVPGAALALRVRLAGRTDVIVCGAEAPVSVEAGGQPARFEGAVGVLSLAGEEVEHAYALGRGGWTRGEFALVSGGPQALALRAVERDALVLDGPCDALPGVGDVVRLTAADGWVYPYTIAGAERDGRSVRLRVAEGPGLTFDPDAQELRLTAFPQSEHRGAVRVEWMVSFR